MDPTNHQINMKLSQRRDITISHDGPVLSNTIKQGILKAVDFCGYWSIHKD